MTILVDGFCLASSPVPDNDHGIRGQFTEIRLRACVRIGELSRELEKAEQARTDLRI